MTEDRNDLEAKRQEALERLRTRRGEARRAISQNQQDQEDSELSSFQRLREIRADVARGADINEQSALEVEEQNTAKALQLRQSRRAKRQASQQLDLPGDNEAIASLQGEDEKLVETFRQIQQARRANRPGKKTPRRQPKNKQASRKRQGINNPVYPTDMIREIHQQLLGEIETALSATSLEQLEQRRKDLKYRHDWLQSLLEEMREELDRVQEHIISRLLTSQPSETPQPPSNS